MEEKRTSNRNTIGVSKKQWMSEMTPGEEFTLGGSLALTTSCAHLYTCPFWISVRLYLRGKSKSDKQSGVFPRENKTKVNYNKLDY